MGSKCILCKAYVDKNVFEDFFILYDSIDQLVSLNQIKVSLRSNIDIALQNMSVKSNTRPEVSDFDIDRNIFFAKAINQKRLIIALKENKLNNKIDLLFKLRDKKKKLADDLNLRRKISDSLTAKIDYFSSNLTELRWIIANRILQICNIETLSREESLSKSYKTNSLKMNGISLIFGIPFPNSFTPIQLVDSLHEYILDAGLARISHTIHAIAAILNIKLPFEVEKNITIFIFIEIAYLIYFKLRSTLLDYTIAPQFHVKTL